MSRKDESQTDKAIIDSRNSQNQDSSISPIKASIQGFVITTPTLQQSEPLLAKLKTVGSDPNLNEKKKRMDLKDSISPDNVPSTSSHQTPAAPNIPEASHEESEYDYQPSDQSSSSSSDDLNYDNLSNDSDYKPPTLMTNSNNNRSTDLPTQSDEHSM